MKKDKTPVLLFGASSGCNNFLNFIHDEKTESIYEFIGIADNDPKKHGKHVQNIPIISPNEIPRLDFDKVIITSIYAVQIKKQLITDFSIDESIIFQAPKKSILPTKKSRPFEDAIQRQNAELLLQSVCNLLTKNKLNIFIDHGTLLGLIREQRILPWDDDIDMSIHEQDYMLAKQILKRHKKQLEYIVDGNISFVERAKPHNTYELGIEIYIRDQFTYMVSLKTLSFAKNFAWQAITKAPEYHFISAEYRLIDSFTYPVPTAAENYLSYHYGDDWKTPKKNTSFLDIKNFVEPPTQD